jgi:hypothetical protein
MPDLGAAANPKHRIIPHLGSQSIFFKEGLKERCTGFLNVLVSGKMSIKRKLYGG